ncbi:MAG: hypothetical protein IT478_15995 [Xanthomonadales bacterium]|nr:hypothetical protein [Xanthomonadales bacterium]MCC6562861.1 hypothetical protein [Xanthomonadales bacterium]
MLNEFDVLRIVDERLRQAGIDYMLTGSFAMAFYTTPRMTRDLDLVVALSADQVPTLLNAFAADFYLDCDDARAAVAQQRMFNLMHLDSAIKVDLIVRKNDDYRREEFARRHAVRFGTVDLWIASREDLILSKLVWALESNSELQRRDVRALAQGDVDREYLHRWAPRLGVAVALEAAWA